MTTVDLSSPQGLIAFATIVSNILIVILDNLPERVDLTVPRRIAIGAGSAAAAFLLSVYFVPHVYPDDATAFNVLMGVVISMISAAGVGVFVDGASRNKARPPAPTPPAGVAGAPAFSELAEVAALPQVRPLETPKRGFRFRSWNSE